MLAVEPSRVLAVRLRAGPRSRQIGLTGVTHDPRLQRVVDTTAVPVPLPASGLVLSQSLAEILGVGAGAFVDVDVLEGSAPAPHRAGRRPW